MSFDIKTDAVDIYEYIVSRASNYTPTIDIGPGGNRPIQMIYAGYEFDQEGWFALIFDRRSDAAHDGEWTRYLRENTLERPHWARTALRAGKSFSRSLGEMIVDVLRRAERDGVFSGLPLAIGYWMGIEEFNGSFGWDSQTGDGQPD